jgi:hypothetical protein
MATPSKGVGRGVGGGGRRNGAGRPPGAINRKARELIAQAERENLQTPLDFLLDIMRDPSQELRDRILCATASAPYMHSKRSVVRVIAEPEELNDVQLVKQVEAYERIAAARPEPERAASLGVQLRHHRGCQETTPAPSGGVLRRTR